MTDTLDRLAVENKRLLGRYDPDVAIAYFNTVPIDAPYHAVPNQLRTLWSDITGEFGEDGFEAFQKITMLRLIDRFETRSRGRRYTENIRQQFGSSFRRIVTSIDSSSFTKYRSHNDILLKDLAICRQKVFPAGGARIVEPAAGFSRSLMFKGGVRQGARMVRLLLSVGGNKPFYSHHMHLSELEQFNQKGFEACNLNLADMLKLNPDVRGIHCGSWLYDPALSFAGPRLAYMCEIQQHNGAYLFYAGVDRGGGALAKSKSRRELYDQGKYIPKSYHIVWPRDRVIAWAEQHPSNSGAVAAGPAGTYG